MTLKQTILMVKYHVRNFFNKNNSESEPPEISEKYKLFLALCNEIHEYNKDPANKPGPYTSETVINLHSWTKGSRADGIPVTWADVFADKLEPFKLMFSVR
ncbi:MAG: hypothetical protein FWD23_16125 [Oscillospiraceae bacterium]|nr:hypothetical protein [Oscillospiraceae bacterium]